MLNEETSPPVVTEAEKLQALPWSIASNAGLSVYAQLVVFGSGFVLFLDELGLNKTQIGFLISLISFLAPVTMLAASRAARFGYKRTFITFWGLRYLFSGLFLLTPWVLTRFGSEALLYFITATIALFALFRAVGLNGLVPWQQEFIPDSIKGKYFAADSIVTQLVAFLSVSFAAYIIGQSSSLGRFTLLFGIGTIFGLLSIVVAVFIPGGAPTVRTAGPRKPRLGVLQVLRDGNFQRYLLGTGLVTLAFGPIAAFLPLFMQEQVGLSPGNVVWLQTGTIVGGVITSYLWGWAADRYGSKPVMLSGALFKTVLPVLWLLLPKNSDLSLYAALAIAVLQGMATLGWAIGSTRLFFVGIVPDELRAEYSAVNTSWVGLIGGISLLFSGRLLDATAGYTGQLFFIQLDSFNILFLSIFLLSLISIGFLWGVRADSRMSFTEFTALFLHGNPIMALESLIRYHLAKDESTTITTTERLGSSKSPLTVNELIESLADPRFYVRFEAIISIARRGPDPRLIKALSSVLHGNEPALSVVAAWALGRIGDERARYSLRKGLNSRYRSVQMQSARALGTIGDQEIETDLLVRLTSEEDEGLKIAYASALGKLEAHRAVPALLKLLRTTEDHALRVEIALALGRIVGDEHHFIRLFRGLNASMSTVGYQSIRALTRRIEREKSNHTEFIERLETYAKMLARGEEDAGTGLLVEAIRSLPQANYGKSAAAILSACADSLEDFGPDRPDYLLLALHVLNVGWEEETQEIIEDSPG